MIKLKNGDKVKIISQGFNDYYAGGAFRIRDEMNNRYSLEESNAGYYFTLKDFKYIQPQTLTIEMASDPDVVVNCRTGDDAEYFCTWLDLHRKRWYNNNSYTKENNWGVYHHETCYYPKSGTYYRQDHFQQLHKIIIRFTPTMIQNDPIWAKHEVHNALAHSVKLPNENRDLTEAKKLRGVRSTMYIFEDYKDTELNIRNVFIKNIKFNDLETIVEFAGGRDIKVTCQDCDTYSKEQAITQAIAKYCGYGTKRINEMIEKSDVKEEFKPYLTFGSNDGWLGVIGDDTNLEDIVGRKLQVGDTVELWNNGIYEGEFPIIYDNSKVKVMSVGNSIFQKGKSENFTIILKRKHSDINNCEVVDYIKYIKSPLKSNTK